MAINRVTKENVITPSKYDFSNLFSVNLDESNNYIYNINKTIYIEQFDTYSPYYYSIYEIEKRDTWPLISYKFYDTIELWWIICKANQIVNPTVSPVVGEKIKVLNKDLVEDILRQMKKSVTQ